MWRTSVVLFVGWLAVTLAYPEVRVQNVLAASDALVAEAKQNDDSARMIRSFQDQAVQHAMSLGRHNSFASAVNQLVLNISGQSTVLMFSTDANKVNLNLNVNLDEDLFFVFENTCSTTACASDQKNTQHYYDASGKNHESDSKGNEIQFDYTIPSSGNEVKGFAYKDRIGTDDKTTIATAQLFATAEQGNDQKKGLPGGAEGTVGLGFEQTGAVEFNTVNNLFAYTNGNPYITIKRDAADMTKGVIAIGHDKFPECNVNRTTGWQTAFYSDKTKSNYWWFKANATIGSVSESVIVKIDLNSDNILLPANYLAEIDKSGGNNKDKSISDFNKLPTLQLTLPTKEVLNINGTVYSNGKDKLYTDTINNGKSEYTISLGSPFLRYYCTILYGNANKYSMAFTMPDPAPTKFATVSGVSFMALALVPLVNLFRF